MAKLAIDLQNLWLNFMRAYYLSLTRAPMGESGKRQNGGQINGVPFQTALDAAVSRFNPKKKNPKRRHEPPWHKPDTLMTLSKHLGFSHDKQIAAAFGYGFKVFDDLPKFRNFFAHRNEDTCKEAQLAALSYGVSAMLRPSKILALPAVGRPQPIIFDWVDEVKLTAEHLCQ